MSVRETLRPKQELDLQKLLSLDAQAPDFSDRRTGKTRKALAIAEALGCKRPMLVGRNSFLQAWEDELFTLEVKGNPYYLDLQFLLDGSVADRGYELKRLAQRGEPFFTAVNYEAWWRDEIRGAIRQYVKPDLIIYDEAHALLGRGRTHVGRFAIQIASREPWFEHALALTATPMEGGLDDLFAIYRSVQPKTFGTDFEMFKQDFCIVATHFCAKCKDLVSELKQAPTCGEDGWHKGPFIPIPRGAIIGFKNKEKLFDIVRRTSTRTKQSDENILPPINELVPVKLKPETMRQYRAFMDTIGIPHRFTGEADAIDVLAKIQLTALVKARQIANGWVQNESSAVDFASEKLDAIKERVDRELKNGRQTAIYASLNHDIQRLAKTFGKDLNMTYSSFAGPGTKGKRQRKEILRSLLTGNLDLVIGNDKMIAYGLNLSMCSTAHFFSTDFSSIIFDQLNGRCQAPNKQPWHGHYAAEGTIESELIYPAQIRKAANRAQVFDEEVTTFKTPGFEEFIKEG